jgi:uncharacterized protein
MTPFTAGAYNRLSVLLSSRAFLLAGAAGCLLVTGCAGGVSHQDVANFDTSIARGDYKSAAQTALASGQIGPDGRSNNLAWSLDAGAALTYAGDAPHAVAVLDGAEALMKARDLDNFTNTQYHYATYDGVMANTYKAVDFLVKGDPDNARVEFNRLEDRQRRAEDDFAKEKARLDAEVQSRAAKGGIDMSSVMRSALADSQYQDAMRDVQNYANYRPFINPFATYLFGIYMINAGGSASDIEKGRRALNEVQGLVGSNPVVASDIALSNSPTKAAHTWVVFENGKAPTFAEYRITIPVPLIGKTKGVSTITVAMPRMVFYGPA